MKPPNFKDQNKNYKESVNYYNGSTSNPSLHKTIEPVYNENNKKQKKNAKKW